MSPSCSGVFGNGTSQGASTCVVDFGAVSEGALATRSSIAEGLKEIPEKVASSRLGTPISPSTPPGTVSVPHHGNHFLCEI
mmetsp:Transcript_2930/g.3979  ORF Transcript_2930/g.3979 Transcript_2930/m.3979 type:complete len:81 (-) Transcript_2930:196-438(-)